MRPVLQRQTREMVIKVHGYFKEQMKIVGPF